MSDKAAIVPITGNTIIYRSTDPADALTAGVLNGAPQLSPAQLAKTLQTAPFRVGSSCVLLPDVIEDVQIANPGQEARRLASQQAKDDPTIRYWLSEETKGRPLFVLFHGDDVRSADMFTRLELIDSLLNTYFDLCGVHLGVGSIPTEGTDALPLYVKLGGRVPGYNVGVPYYAVVDSAGNVMTTSLVVMNTPNAEGNPQLCNMGLPALAASIDWFLRTMKLGAPAITAAELQAMHEILDVASIAKEDCGPGPVLGTDGTMPVAQNDGSEASRMLEEAKLAAWGEEKNILLLFGSTLCGDCQQMRAMLADATVGPILADAFVVVDLKYKLFEGDDASTPGAEDLYKALGGRSDKFDPGLPLYFVLDTGGKVLVSSLLGKDFFYRAQYNIGFPGTGIGLTWFMQMLSDGAPSLSAEELATIANYVLKNSLFTELFYYN